MDEEDLFSAHKYIYCAGKILGTILYSVNNRVVRVTKFDIALLLVHFLVLLMLLMSCLTRMDDYFNWGFNVLLSFILFIFYFFLLPVAIVFAVFNHARLKNILNRLDKIRGLKIDYCYVRKFSLVLMIVSYSLCLVYTIIDQSSRIHSNDLNIEQQIFYMLCIVLPTSMECQIIILLLILKRMSSKVNWNIRHYIRNKIHFKRIMILHSQLYEISKDVNRLLDFLVIRLITTFSGLAYTLFKTVGNAGDWLYIINCHSWNLSNLFNIVIIAYLAKTTKEEVR